MGFFDSIRNGADRDIRCESCGSVYSGTLDRSFPYEICGICLERVGEKAKRNGDNGRYQQVQIEFRRRGSNWS